MMIAMKKVQLASNKGATMRVKALSIVALAVVALIVAPAAMAGVVNVNDIVKVVGYNSLNNAGVLTLSDITNGTDLETFCIERHVTVPFNKQLLVADISKSLTSGGILDQNVDYLFALYVADQFDMYNIDTDLHEQVALQNVIWAFQGQMPWRSAWQTSALTREYKYYQLALANAGAMPNWDTYVLNLYRVNPLTGVRTPVQNMLYHVPVPEPSTLILLGLGLAVAGLARRKD
jgi:hypothetical protein